MHRAPAKEGSRLSEPTLDGDSRGVFTIHDIMHAKMLRMKSVMEAMYRDPNYAENFESLEDSAKDLINYSSFFISYLRGSLEGQRSGRNIFNEPKK